jgi:hypothetical protein
MGCHAIAHAWEIAYPSAGKEVEHVIAASLPADIRELLEQLDAAESDAMELVATVSDEQGARRPRAGSWSIAECLDHLATANRVYVRAMQESAARARMRGSPRRGPAIPGWIGRWFVNYLEPPPRWWSMRRAPRSIRPGAAGLKEALASFLASQGDVRAFLRAHADLDLARVRFRNPFIRGVRFSLATGLHVIAAHERRHLWQARRVRQAIDHAR